VGSTRIEYIDLAKGLCIILVVFNHANYVLAPVDYPLSDALCVMRMPLYFFLSGLFFKPYESYFGFQKRKINKLLIPFLFFRIGSCIITPFVNDTPFEWHKLWDFLYSPLSAPNTPIWFLMCLYWLNQMFYGIYKIGSKSKCPIAVISILSLLLGIIGFEIGRTPYNISAMNIGTAMTATPFFCAGYLFKSHTKILYPSKSDKYLLIPIVACAIYTFYFAKTADYFTNRYESNIWITYSCGITGVLSVIFLSKIIKWVPLVSYFGRYSIIILVTHMPILQRLIPYLKHFEWQPWYITLLVGSLVTMFLYIFIIPLMRKLFPHVTAQKDAIPISNIE